MYTLFAFSIPHALELASVTTLILLAYVYLLQINYNRHVSRLPQIRSQQNKSSEEKRQTYLKSAKALYNEGYEKFTECVYRMANADGIYSVVIPTKLMPELRRLPDTVLSSGKAVADFLEVKYTHILAEEEIVAHTIKADLTPALVRLNPIICEEVDKAIQADMPECNDWTPVRIYGVLANMVAKVSGRVFVGPELCRDENYLEAGVQYTMELMDAQRRVKNMRPFLRPFLADRLPEVRQLRKREKMAIDFLRPIVEARLEGEKAKDWKEPDDLLQWFLKRRTEHNLDSMAKLAKLQLGIIFTAIHTTTMTATNIFYSLAVTPEYIEPIREEIREVLAANGGVMSSKALQEMEKLDSYMKEVFRMYPNGYISFLRKVLKGVTLSNGQYIPPGVNLEVPVCSIYRDNSFYPDSDTFDGFRSYKLRKAEVSAGNQGVSARNQFVNVSEQNIGFGYGRHACPGRFFAVNEIKMFLARMLLKYDIKMVEGVTTRWANIETGAECMPDGSKEVLFKKVA